MDLIQQDRLDAAVLRRLIEHLQHRVDVQNIDLMGWGGFCRNCLADWYAEAAKDEGLDMGREAARERIYGMSYDQFKSAHQQPASAEQLARMEASVARNRQDR
jgi:uncharacterized protein